MEPAFDRTLALLFKPFKIMQWITLGFVFWLGGLVAQSLIPLRILDYYSSFVMQVDLATFAIERLREVAGGLFLVGVLCAVLWIALTWVSARAQFTFLEQVLLGSSDWQGCWSRTKTFYRSYFFWEMGFGVVRLAWLAFALFGSAVALRGVLQTYPDPRLVVSMGLLAFLIFFIVGVLVEYTHLLVRDFVMLVMYKQRVNVVEAWGSFWPIFKSSLKEFYFYALMKLLVLTGVSLFAGITCCVSTLPFLGTVFLLPFYVFIRLYSIEFLSQFGEAWIIDQKRPPPLPLNMGE